ncbi:E3 ubiquitin-protein ligase SIRP1 isoform X1 [Brassica rapa]|uniref:RING-type E3 ubiquitin transferase n=1 Tax=Brassica napus TaxID=3708 RepID=A0A816S515_BRANA|nr:E3 ubiquitin-protein ligase SIRP1 isoform X1 [Brassica rapa]CAF2080795.1 unnamed protein product [Brassica napus]
MEEETTAYWCHTCSQTVTSLTTEEAGIKCPFCQSGFLEEMQQREDTNVHRPMDSILTPIFMEMMNNSARIHPGADMDSQLQEILRRRGRRPVSIDQLLQGIYAGLTLAPAAAAADDNNRERGRVIVTNPYNQIVAVPSSAVSNTLPPVAGSLSEYFIGPEFEAMLESLTETDPRRYGTPPARRDAFEALASVEIKEAEAGLECCVCLDDFEMGTVGKQMPCISYRLRRTRQMVVVVGLLRQAAAARDLRAPEMMMVIGACSTIPWKLSHLVLNIAEQYIGAREDDETTISCFTFGLYIKKGSRILVEF